MTEKGMIYQQMLEEYKELTKDCSDCNQYRGEAVGFQYFNLCLVFCHNHRDQFGQLINKGYITISEAINNKS